MDARDALQFTPLIYAAMGGHTATCEELLKLGADVNAESALSTALFGAAMEGHTSTCMTLLKFGADLKAVDDQQRNSIDIAASFGHKETSTALLAYLENGTAPAISASVTSNREAALSGDSLNGNIAVLTGLKSKPLLNGKTVTIMHFNEKKQRHAVCLDAGDTMLIKRGNLRSAGPDHAFRDRRINEAMATIMQNKETHAFDKPRTKAQNEANRIRADAMAKMPMDDEPLLLVMKFLGSVTCKRFAFEQNLELLQVITRFSIPHISELSRNFVIMFFFFSDGSNE